MVEALSNIITSFGLSASAGLNAYLTLLIVALIARFTDLIQLQAPFTALTNGWALATLAVLTLVEILADKIPAVDTANDLLESLVRPAAGAVLFAASSNVIADLHPVLALICGLFVAGTVHVAKSTARPVVTATTAGIGNPVVSTVEDLTAATVSVVSIVFPLFALLLILVGIWILWRVWRRNLSHS